MYLASMAMTNSHECNMENKKACCVKENRQSVDLSPWEPSDIVYNISSANVRVNDKGDLRIKGETPNNSVCELKNTIKFKSKSNPLFYQTLN